MKKILLAFSIMLCGQQSLFAQWATSGNNISNTNSGYVGVGTSTPTSFLNIAGNSSTNVEVQADHYYSGFGASTLQLRKARGTKTAPTTVANGDYIGSIEAWGYSGGFVRAGYIGTVTNGTPVSGFIPADMVFATNNGAWPDAIEWMRLDKNGNLGIGTTTPNAKLAVNGNIRAKEVKVEISNWPDYVFAKEHTLMSLGEIETHIKDKGHLPGFPSAAEAEADGVQLGEMNKKLLEKIEELTLYLIQQNQELKALKEDLRLKQIRIDQLGSQIEK